MSRMVFLLEERSMKVLLEGLLPRMLPGIQFICIPHEGKQDLERSILRKLRAWREPGARFIIVRDNDGGDCLALKQRLAKLCNEAGRADVLIRIACQELEAWYFGEPAAMAKAFGNHQLSEIGKKSKYQNPDAIAQPSKEIIKFVPDFQKISGARKMARYISPDGNHSQSFGVFLAGLIDSL